MGVNQDLTGSPIADC